MKKMHLPKKSSSVIVAAVAIGCCVARNAHGARTEAKAARSAAQKIMNGILKMTAELARIEKLRVYDSISDELINAVEELEKIVQSVRELEAVNLRVTGVPLDYGETFDASHWRKPDIA